MQVKNVIVVPYNPIWKNEFLKIKKHIEPFIIKNILEIEHIGSTAVDGLSSKPIIDIDIVIENYDSFDLVKQGLESIGYYYEGDLGIKDREAFAYNDDEPSEFMNHHLYVCPRNSEELHRHITFRNHLRANKDDRDKYGEIKIAAARKYPTDIESYLVMKGIVITEIYKKCGL